MENSASTGGKDIMLQQLNRHPEYSGIRPDRRGEFLTRDGAFKCAKRIEQFWHERGFTWVTAYIEQVVFAGKARVEFLSSSEKERGCYQIRSNLVNGLPPVVR